MRAEDFLLRALELSRDERNRLAALLMDSVEAGEDDGDVEAAWTDEVTRRLDAHEQGSARAIPAETVFAEAWSRVKSVRG